MNTATNDTTNTTTTTLHDLRIRFGGAAGYDLALRDVLQRARDEGYIIGRYVDPEVEAVRPPKMIELDVDQALEIAGLDASLLYFRLGPPSVREGQPIGDWSGDTPQPPSACVELDELEDIGDEADRAATYGPPPRVKAEAAGPLNVTHAVDLAKLPPSTPVAMMHETHPHSLRSCSRVTWFIWALGQFNLFDRAPALTSMTWSAWLDQFEKWLRSGAANTRVRSVAAFLLHAYNHDYKVRGAEAIEVVFGGMDSTNRAGVCRVLQHWRTF